MEPVKVGEILCCDCCGVELTVTKACGCDPCEIVCCGKPMVKKESSGGCCG